MNSYLPDNSTRTLYLQNKLSESEVDDFELWLADNPSEVDELELDLMLQSGVSKHVSSHLNTQSNIFGRHQSSYKKWVLAASLILVFMSTFIFNSYYFNNTTQGLIIAQPHDLYLMRSSSRSLVEINSAKDSLLQIEVKKPLYKSLNYSLEIRQFEKVIKTLNGITAESNLISLVILADTLAVGDYDIWLINSENKQPITYGLKVVQ